MGGGGGAEHKAEEDGFLFGVAKIGTVFFPSELFIYLFLYFFFMRFLRHSVAEEAE